MSWLSRSLRKWHNFCFWSRELAELTLSVPCKFAAYLTISVAVLLTCRTLLNKTGGGWVRAVKFMSVTVISCGGITLVILLVWWLWCSFCSGVSTAASGAKEHHTDYWSQVSGNVSSNISPDNCEHSFFCFFWSVLTISYEMICWVTGGYTGWQG